MGLPPAITGWNNGVPSSVAILHCRTGLTFCPLNRRLPHHAITFSFFLFGVNSGVGSFTDLTWQECWLMAVFLLAWTLDAGRCWMFGVLVALVFCMHTNKPDSNLSKYHDGYCFYGRHFSLVMAGFCCCFYSPFFFFFFKSPPKPKSCIETQF